ncbi:MAG: calcium/sodium antiporter [Patescibacteria group bacterium]
MNLLLWFLLFFVTLLALVKSANIFTRYAEKLGHVLGMSQFIVGVVIVAIGTSLPELATSLSSVIQRETGMVSGNVLGTVIANILLGLGLAAIFSKKIIKIKHDIFQGDFPIFIGAILLVFFTMMDGNLTPREALLFLLGFIVYLSYSRIVHRDSKESSRQPFSWKIIWGLVISLAIIALSSHWIIKSIIEIAGLLGFGTSVLAASLIAVGTSLPEIAVAITAVRRGNHDLLIGNIIGSNIFDIFVILGASGLITTLVVPQVVVTLIIPFILAVSILYWVVSHDRKINRAEGLLMILIYLLFIGKLFSFI